MVDTPTENINIQLGDIIEIVAPENPNLNLQQFYIDFINNDKIIIINIENQETITLNIIDGEIEDKSISSINLLSRSDTSSYAKQHNLLPGVWIEIVFNTIDSLTIKGLITNLEEDMIEVTTYPNSDIIYIDFGYQGIPEELLIDKIILIKNPSVEETLAPSQIESILQETGVDTDEAAPDIIQTKIEQAIFDANQIELGEDLDEITIFVEVPEDEKRYSVEQQTNDLLDELLGSVPTEKRTDKLLNYIHTIIQRFVQLRSIYSKFDSNGYAIMPDPIDDNIKPIIENISTLQIGDQSVSELILNDDSIQGTFTVSEEVRGTASDTDDFFVKANVTGIPGNKNITNDGSLNSTTDTISISGGGEGGLFQVEEIGPGKVTEIIIDNAGTGYSIGDTLTFTNTGTKGNNAAGFVSIVNGGFSGQDDTPGMSTGDRIVLEDETTRGDQYEGKVIVQEAATDLGQITDLFITNGGNQYTSLPTVSVSSSTGSNATVRAYGDEIGKVVKVKTVELGRSYENSPTPPTLGFFNNSIVTSVSGTFVVDDTITSSSGGSGTIVSLDSDRGLLKIKDVTGNFNVDDTLTSATSGTCTLKKSDVATASVDVVSVADTDGEFINEKGKLSETTMRIQDSLYYQDYSYVIKVGQSIVNWRDAFKKTMHTAGFYFTGQVDIESRITVTAGGPVKGVTSGREEVPFLQIANTLFSTIFGRRLGTTSDGTSLRAKPKEEGTLDVSNDYRDPFASNTRDVTLTREDLEIDYLSRKRNKITDPNNVVHDVRSGYAYAGPRFGSLNRFHNTVYGTSAADSFATTFENLNNLRITGTKTEFDNQAVPLFMFSTEVGRSIKTNYAFPSQFAASAHLFSNTLTKFDSGLITFDDTTP